jgi:outer membrane protein assembly factor BamB
MRSVSALAIMTLAFGGVAKPQGRALDWPSYGGDARRTGWERSDTRITRENIKDFQLVLKKKLEGSGGGPRSLTAPVVIGLLISYRGFKELGLVSDSAGDLWALDVDLSRIFWKRRFEGSSPKRSSTGPCSGVAVTPALTPPVTFGGGRRPSAPAPAAVRTTDAPTRVGGSGFGVARSVFVLTPDGKLHQVNSSDGSDQFPPLDFLPPGARASSLTLDRTAVYTTTSGNCGGTPNGVWAIDLNADEPRPVHFELNSGEAGGPGGFAMGHDGTVYVQTGSGEMDPAANKWANTLLALAPNDLKLQGHFTISDSDLKTGWSPAMPVVFDYAGRDFVATAGSDGRIYLLDPASIGGDDHKTALHQTVRIASENGGIWGGLSTWQDADGTRWLAAPIWGPVSEELKPLATNGPTPHGAIVAFKVQEQSGAMVLTPTWVSRDLNSPVPPVITAGVVFALSTGGGQTNERAILYALDGITGKELYATGDQVGAPGSLTGLTVANGRVYFTTIDGTLYAFGIRLEI